ncbi:MAG TPA: hypothetical protein VFG51_02475 [Candidatus Saccharimonadia bacterium]|nr:hypothetical protein [Candidatus Saccharimonadia bacterium]
MPTQTPEANRIAQDELHQEHDAVPAEVKAAEAFIQTGTKNPDVQRTVADVLAGLHALEQLNHR